VAKIAPSTGLLRKAYAGLVMVVYGLANWGAELVLTVN